MIEHFQLPSQSRGERVRYPGYRVLRNQNGKPSKWHPRRIVDLARVAGFLEHSGQLLN